jgi:ABC-type multidrug transport system fused ATPase/permease subunit
LQELYHKALYLPVRWHQDNHSGATINRIRKAYEALRDFFQNGFEYLHTFFKFVFSLAAMLWFAPVFGLVGVIMGFFVVLIILKFDRPYIETQREINERENVVSSTLFDSLSNIITVITLRLEKRMEAGLFKKVMEILPSFKRNVAINEWKWFVTDMLVGLIYAIILVGYVWQNHVPGQIFQLGGLVMLMGYVVRHHTDVRSAFDVLEAYQIHHLPEADKSLPAQWKKLEIRQLSFSHRTDFILPESNTAEQEGTAPKRYPAGLQNVNLVLQRGKRIALVGESGSGKSTILALLRGLYPPDAGTQTIVDGNVQEGLDLISSNVTLFPQEPEIFENTIEYNITLGLPFDPAELDALCRTVHFTAVVEQLPNGLKSSIMEKGVNLSGGQKQRLALARGMFAAKDSDLILLDEPTSSVDPKTEALIYDRMFAEFSDKVVVSALHRLHLLNRFDYIYVLDKGRVVAEGTLQTLLKESAAFKGLWMHQEYMETER